MGRHSLPPARASDCCRLLYRSRSTQSNGDRWPSPAPQRAANAQLAKQLNRIADPSPPCRVCPPSRVLNSAQTTCRRANCCIRPAGGKGNEIKYECKRKSVKCCYICCLTLLILLQTSYLRHAFARSRSLGARTYCPAR